MKTLTLALVLLAAAGAHAQFLRGGDPSEIPEVQASGGVFYDHGVKKDPLVILKEHGFNIVRFRVWVNPEKDGAGNYEPIGYCGKAATLAMAKRAARAGLKIAIDLHYSDWWADPQKQYTPEAWKSLNHTELVKQVYDYTKDIVQALVEQGTPPAIVQPGNEIRQGMLWPDGRITTGTPEEWRRLTDLVKAGLRAIRDAGGPHVRTMIHIDKGGDNAFCRGFVDHLLKAGVRFDILGLSYYPWWHGTVAQLKANLADLSRRYGKDLMVAETAYPFTTDFTGHPWGHAVGPDTPLVPGYPASPEGQAGFLKLLCQTMEQTPGGHGIGVLYWAPAWIDTKTVHNNWDNLTLFDYAGNALPGIDALGGK